MQVEKLNKYIIDEFADALKNANAKTTPFEVFFESITTLINPYETEVNENIQKMVNNCQFKSIDDTNNFLQKYNIFMNGCITFIDSIISSEDRTRFEKDVDILFQSFYKNGNIKENYEVFNDGIYLIIAKTIEVYEIDMSKFSFDFDPDEYMNYLTSIFGNKEVGLQFGSLMDVSIAMHDSEIDADNFEDHQTNFIVLCLFVSILNEFRKDKYSDIQKNRSSVLRSQQDNPPKVGRNDPCPCGSGKKYKKCCINKKIESKVNPLDELSLPMATHFPLSDNDKEAFLSLLFRLMDFMGKIFCDHQNKKYKKLYTKDESGKYRLSQEAYEDNYYTNVRGFLAHNFDKAVDDFISSSRVSKANIEILTEWKQNRLYSDDFLIYERSTVGSLVWHVDFGKYYNVYNLDKSMYELSKEDTLLSMLLLPYKGRIVFDGVIAQVNIDFGQNAKDKFLKDYIELRKTKDATQELPKYIHKLKIYQLKISIKGAKPPIWRRVLVDSDMTYFYLHHYIQNIFEWYGGHLHEFNTQNASYIDKDIDDDFMDDFSEDETKFTIKDDMLAIGDKIRYTYDFGDDWEHLIVLEDILDAVADKEYPVCIKGKGQGPLEDIGGIWVYNEIVQAYKDGDREKLEEFDVDDDFDPFEFDLDYINE